MSVQNFTKVSLRSLQVWSSNIRINNEGENQNGNRERLLINWNAVVELG